MARYVVDLQRDKDAVITALVPCFNAERYLDEAIASIRAQTRPVDQIIVVDDCSTDASRIVAKRHGVVLVQTPVNSGHATARNLGIAAADGDVIAWLDADDYWAPNHVETVVGLLERFPQAAVAFSGAASTTRLSPRTRR
jgi:glycosyltransferase involved in cell wall biosynthesis